MTKRILSNLSLILGMTLSSSCFAHPGHVTSSSFWSGFLHPLTGLDHLAALIFIGIFAVLCEKKAALKLLLLVAVSLIAGFMIGVEWRYASEAESWVGISMIALPFCLVAYRFVGSLKMLAVVAIGVFSVCHGLVQGAEAQGKLIEYGLGTMSASLIIMCLTLFIGNVIKAAINTLRVA